MNPSPDYGKLIVLEAKELAETLRTQITHGPAITARDGKFIGKTWTSAFKNEIPIAIETKNRNQQTGPPPQV